MKKIQLLYINDDKVVCDGCDELKRCASVKDIYGNVTVVCKDCLKEIVKQF